MMTHAAVNAAHYVRYAIWRKTMNPTYRTVRKRLRAIRQAKGLTLSEASRLTRTTAMTLGSWERGDRKPTLENLIHLCNRYEVSIESLVKEEEPIQLLMKIYHKQLTQGRMYNEQRIAR